MSIIEFLRQHAANCTLRARECFDLDSAKHFRLTAEALSRKADEIERGERNAERPHGSGHSDRDGHLDA